MNRTLRDHRITLLNRQLQTLKEQIFYFVHVTIEKTKTDYCKITEEKQNQTCTRRGKTLTA